MTLGDLLAAARDSKGLTKVAAAETLDVTEMTYRQWEEDRWKPDTRDRSKVEAIADYAGVEPAVVLWKCGVLTEEETSKIVGKVARLF